MNTTSKKPTLLSFDSNIALGVGLREAILIEYLLSKGEDYVHLSLNEIKDIILRKSYQGVHNLIERLVCVSILHRDKKSSHSIFYKVNFPELENFIGKFMEKNEVNT